MRCLLLCAVALTTGTAIHAETLFAIGSPGDGWRELAAAGNHRAAGQLAVAGVEFQAGRSRPSETWPYLHPGPADAWAGNRQHTYKVRFQVGERPDVPALLEICLWNTHYSLPPTLRVELNGHHLATRSLPAGKDDRSLTDPGVNSPQRIRLPFPPDRLARGENVLALAVTRGSWLIYDSVTLRLDPEIPMKPLVDRMEAAGTSLFKRLAGNLRQAVSVTVHNAGIEGEGTLEVEGDPASRTRIVLPPGESRHYALVEPATAPTSLTVLVTAGEGAARRALARVEPHRRWTVYVAPSSHTDIGYTDLQPRTMETHLRNTLQAMDALRAIPGLRWNLEVAFQAELVRQKAASRYRELLARLRSGELGIQALYLNMLTGLCTGEELLRALEPAQRVAREARASSLTACLNDVPSAVGTLPMLLRHAGVRYFVNAVNQDRGPSFAGAPPQRVQHPFWWEAPDGSRVLAYFSTGYAQAAALGITVSLDAMERQAPAVLGQYDQPHYLPDSFLVYGAFSDNQAIEPAYAAHVAEWNRRWDYPRFVLCRPEDYFKDVERRFGAKLPVYRGDMGAYWEDGAASSAAETRLNRVAVARAESAERWMAVRTLLGQKIGKEERNLLDSLWRSALFYDEHTWGAWESIANPSSEQTRKQWEHKAAYARDAYRMASAAVRPPSMPPTGGSWIVWNPLPWSRDILCRLQPRTGLRSVEVRTANGRAALPVQRVEKRAFFVVPNVPAMGYRIVHPGSASTSTQPLLKRTGEWTWTTPRFVLTLDPRTGGISSLRERADGREWVDSARGWTLNQYLYVVGGEGTGMVHSHLPPPVELDIRTHSRAAVDLMTNGPVLGVLRIRRTAEESRADPVDTYLTVHANGDLQFTNIVHKSPTLRKEGGYFAFPLRVQGASARRYVDLPHGYVEIGAEQLPGACRLWHAAVGYAALSDGRSTAYLATPDAPLVAFDDIFRGRWTPPAGPPSGTVLGFAFNNYWHTNYKASQGGELVFSYTLRLARGTFDASAASRFGAEARVMARNYPFDYARSQDAVPAKAGSLPEAAAGVAVSGGSVILGGFRLMDGAVHVRLVNPGPKDALATVRLPARILRARRVDLMGRTLGPATLRDGALSARVPARGIATFAVQAEAGGGWLAPDAGSGAPR